MKRAHLVVTVFLWVLVLVQEAVAPGVKVGVLASDKETARTETRESGAITITYIELPDPATDKSKEYQRLTEVQNILKSQKVALVIAPEDATILIVTESLKIPYMTISLSRCLGAYQFCFLPQPEDFGQAMIDLVEAYDIQRFALVYDKTLGSEISQQFVLKSWVSMNVWRLRGNVSVLTVRQTFGTAAADHDIDHYVLAVDPTLIQIILKEARYLSILGRNNRWITLNPGFENIGYDKFQHIKPNVSQVTLFDTIASGQRPSNLKAVIFSDISTMLASIGMAMIGWNGDLVANDVNDQLSTNHYIGKGGNIQFDSQGRRVNFTLGITNLESTKAFQSARWCSNATMFEKRLQFTHIVPDLTEATLGKSVAKVVIIQEPPFVMRRHRFNELKGNSRWKGYCIDLIEEISRNMGFSYELYEVPDGQYGAKNKFGEWNGIVRQLLSGNATMSVAPLSINAEREQAIDFTKPFKTRGISVIMKKIPPEMSYLQFLKPFHGLVWFCVMLSVVLVAVLEYIFENKCRTVRDEGAVFFDWYESFWFVFGAIVGGSTESTPMTIPGRILTSAWWFFALILVSSYTANLAAFLTIRQIQAPISSVTDLAYQTTVRYGSVENSGVLNFLKYTSIEQFNKMYVHMNTIKEDMVLNSSAGLARVLEGNYAFLWDSTVIDYEVSQNCKLMAIGPEFDNTKGFGIALPVGAPYREQLTMAILNLSDSGRLGELEHKWWRSSKCSKDSSSDDETTELKLVNVAGVFFVLLGGVVLAILLFICEFTPCMRRWRKRSSTA
ncbi:glutamate receptor 1-like [Tubulanus polymorphus]|uniref:glutamate receptor 1-like n=1 Tax=Tubulanus polymorphus TaxID=672921 RepID=UPI003DA3EC4D